MIIQEAIIQTPCSARILLGTFPQFSVLYVRNLQTIYIIIGGNVSQNYHRRHSRWYEVILFNFWFQLVIGFLAIVILPQWLRYGGSVDSLALAVKSNTNTLYANSAAFLLAFIVLRNMYQFPGSRTKTYIFPMIAGSWLLVIAVLFFTRAQYARSILLWAFVFANIWALIGSYLGRRYYTPKLALIPFGRTQEFLTYKNVHATQLKSPSLEGRRYDAIVADLHSDMPAEWQKFLAECTLARIPVYHSQLLIERYTGRVKLTHLSENVFGVLSPSPIYAFFKRILEVLLALATMPIWLTVIIITAIIIKIESPGGAFFTQNRVGLGDKDFTVYKLRSMCKDSEKSGAQFAQANDMRVTRVGKFIRKSRIDELPQFFNVLKGDMSIIGPRPEQRAFVNQFEEEIPFYAYRHVVRPGMSGWAQVTQGYAASEDETRIKLEHDFYYIKNFSLWLDILIVFKTIRTMLTGFGAR